TLKKAAKTASLNLRRHVGMSNQSDVESLLNPHDADQRRVEFRAPKLHAGRHFVSQFIGKGNVVRAVKDGLENFTVSCHACIVETLQRRRILRLDPVKCTRALDLFEPEVGIVIGRFECRPRIELRHGELSQSEGTADSVENARALCGGLEWMVSPAWSLKA